MGGVAAIFWQRPAPRSEWLGFDAYQTWELVRSSGGHGMLIDRYVVDALSPMTGSGPL